MVKANEIMLQHRIYDKSNLRMAVEAMLYRMRVGCPWRDLPVEFGCWHSIYQQFNRWSSKNKLMKIFKDLVQEPDLEWEFIDGCIVRAHQHSSGAAGGDAQAIGKSVGGNTTKIHMSVIPGFTAKYNVHMLVYYEVHATYVEAARRKNSIPQFLILDFLKCLRPAACPRDPAMLQDFWIPRIKRGTSRSLKVKY